MVRPKAVRVTSTYLEQLVKDVMDRGIAHGVQVGKRQMARDLHAEMSGRGIELPELDIGPDPAYPYLRIDLPLPEDMPD